MKKSKAYKLVAFDVDGVLNEHGGNIMVESKQAIAKLHRANIPVVYASGKHIWYIAGGLYWSGLMRDNTLIIGENGGVVFNPHTRKMQLYEDHLAHVHLMRNIVYSLNLKRNGYIRFGDMQVWEEPKMTLFNLYPDKVEDCDKLGVLLRDIILKNDLDLYTVVNPDSVDVLQKGASKMVGIGLLCEWLGITTDEVIAFGDSTNDFEMLEGVGFCVTLKNGKDNIKKLVQKRGKEGYIASKRCGEGVLEAVQFLFDSKRLT